jgi:hypothetical protein
MAVLWRWIPDVSLRQISWMALAALPLTAIAQPAQPAKSYYGKLGVVVLSSTPQGLDLATQVGRIAYGSIAEPPKQVGKAEISLTGGLKSFNTASGQEGVAGLARELASGHIAQIEFEPRSKDGANGLLTVDFSDVVSTGLKNTRVILVQYVTNFAAKVKDYAGQVQAKILQAVSSGEYSPVHLRLYTMPGEATCIFGLLEPLTTNKVGEAEWWGPMKRGVVVLQVEKLDYLDFSEQKTIAAPRAGEQFFEVSSGKPDDPYIVLTPKNPKQSTTKSSQKATQKR